MTSWPNYVNDARFWLPMTAATHDATNVRTLDVSGNNFHFRLGNGVTPATYPTKLSNRGYYLDGVSNNFVAVSNLTSAITEGTWAAFFRLRKITGVDYQYAHFSGADCRALLLTGTNSIQFYCGDIVNASILTILLPVGQAIFAAGRRTTDGYRHLYVNGLSATPNNTGTTLPSTTVPSNPTIGTSHEGSSFWHGHWEYALTELQLRDLEAKLRRQLNDV